MADRYLLESSATDGYLLEDGTGVLLLEGVALTQKNLSEVTTLVDALDAKRSFKSIDEAATLVGSTHAIGVAKSLMGRL